MRRRGCWPLLLVLLLLAAAGAETEFERQDEEPFVGWQGESYDPSAASGSSAKDGPWIETLSWRPRAFLYHNFLSDDEAEHLIELARPHMERSEVVDNASGGFKLDEVRTSSGYFLKRGQDTVVAALEQRIAEWTRLPVDHAEPFHVLNYAPGQQYESHWDYFFDDINQRNGGQRQATVLLYLSDVEEGGETVFPKSLAKPSAHQAAQFSECGRQGIAVKPRKGDALLFWNLKPDATKDPASLHGGCPVIRGQKWSATKWIRVREHTAY